MLARATGFGTENMGVFSELFAEEPEPHDDPPVLIFDLDEETSLIVVQNRL